MFAKLTIILFYGEMLMKKSIWPLLLIFFVLGGLVILLVGKVILPPQPRPESVQAISENWAESAHADRESFTFNYWNEYDPPEIPAFCAKCHSAYGYLDYLGEDGSEAFVVDSSVPIGSVVTCQVCHNPSAHEKNVTLFPSGVKIDIHGMSSNCAECHQGYSSGDDVTKAVVTLPEDEVNENLEYISAHYKVDGALRFGTEAMIGYQYPGKTYAGFFRHVPSFQNCTDCHDPHSLQVTPSDCATCHSVVTDYSNLHDIREAGRPDYDGDGNTTEGIHYEIATLHEALHDAIKAYSLEVAGQQLVYAFRYPYWVVDTNGNGVADPDEINYGNLYKSWTPRLVKAAYNFDLIVHSAGAFVHNPQYAIQLLYDTIEDLASVIDVDMTNMVRPD
jgi:hypothetical protein